MIKDTWTILHPQQAPFRSLRSAVPDVALGQGEFSQAVNVRVGAGNVPQFRYPAVIEGSGGTTTFSGTPVGAWTGILNGAKTSFLITQVSSNPCTALQVSIPTNTYTSRTQSSGQYGDTRFTSSPQIFSFAVVKDARKDREYLVIQDGTNSPRVFDSVANTMAVNQAISAPTKNPSYPVIATFPKFFTCKDASTTTYTNSTAARHALADSGASSTDNQLAWTIDSTVLSGDTAQVVFGTAIDLSACDQLLFFIETTYLEVFDRMKVELKEGATYTTIWDCDDTTSKYQKSTYSIDTQLKRQFVSFSIAHVPTGDRDAADGIRFTFGSTVSAPSVDRTVAIYMIAGSGKVRFPALHAISYMNDASRGESPGLWFTLQDYKGELVKNLGAKNSLDVRLPLDAQFFYQYNITFQNTSTTERDRGVDYLNIYRTDIGENTALRSYVTRQQIASYSAPNWSFSSGSALSLRTYSDNNSVETKDPTVLAPDELTQTIPIGTWMSTATDRLFVCGLGGSNRNNALWASEYRNPFRFRRSHDTETDGTRIDFAGELVTASLARPTSGLGLDDLVVWTDQYLYTIDATSASAINRPTRIAPYGTLTPYTVASSDQGIYWLDQEKHVRYWAGGEVEDLSALTIQNKLDTVSTSWPLLVYPETNRCAFGGFWNRRYYLSVDQSGSTSWTNREEPLVFDTRNGGWVEDDIGGSTVSTRFWLPVNNKLYVVSKGGNIPAYESTQGTTDGHIAETNSAGSSYTATLETGMMLTAMPWEGEGIVVREQDFLLEDVSSGSIALTNTYTPSGATATSTASVDGTTTYAWVTSTTPTTADNGEGVGVKLKAVFSGTIAGKFLHAWRALVDRIHLPPENRN